MFVDSMSEMPSDQIAVDEAVIVSLPLSWNLQTTAMKIFLYFAHSTLAETV